MESPIESFAPGDLIRISFSFRYTGGLELGDDIHVVFARPGTDDKLKLEGEVLMSAPEVPGRPYTVYTATARGRVTRDVVPGDYVCKESSLWTRTEMIGRLQAWRRWILRSVFGSNPPTSYG